MRREQLRLSKAAVPEQGDEEEDGEGVEKAHRGGVEQAHEGGVEEAHEGEVEEVYEREVEVEYEVGVEAHDWVEEVLNQMNKNMYGMTSVMGG